MPNIPPDRAQRGPHCSIWHGKDCSTERWADAEAFEQQAEWPRQVHLGHNLAAHDTMYDLYYQVDDQWLLKTNTLRTASSNTAAATFARPG
ncbi:hypothetical protein FA95DRAFT_1607087 [Auriscalpium vulgare]|uniref:Uncharacterized protein n=1 Tax=Auriscalpium vulgare TaxID=40419 RepID=A0ACB8RPY6_9AGAM|nr:hypothetical protein FA95DRAFT_1607087 [Auriscalpium vulgare]